MCVVLQPCAAKGVGTLGLYISETLYWISYDGGPMYMYVRKTESPSLECAMQGLDKERISG